MPTYQIRLTVVTTETYTYRATAPHTEAALDAAEYKELDKEQLTKRNVNKSIKITPLGR